MSTRFLVTVCTLALLSFPLSAHDADHASDWIGNHELKNANGVPCCGVSDCAELQDDAVTETHAGYVVNGWVYYPFDYPQFFVNLREEIFGEKLNRKSPL